MAAKGGKREGAGRKPKGDRPKTKINISLDPEIIAWVDSVTDNRSEFIEEALALALSKDIAARRKALKRRKADVTITEIRQSEQHFKNVVGRVDGDISIDEL